MKKVKLTTTFNLLRQAGACVEGYRKLAKHLGSVDEYGADTPINLLTILEFNGVDDMLWCLRATKENSDKVARLIAADCAESVLYLYEDQYPDDKRPRQAVEATRAFAMGQIDDDARSAAWSAAESAWSAARSAESAWSARSAAWSARSAAWSAAWSARSAAWSAESAESAWSAARSAAWSAELAWSAAWSARSAAESAAGVTQADIIRKYLARR